MRAKNLTPIPLVFRLLFRPLCFYVILYLDGLSIAPLHAVLQCYDTVGWVMWPVKLSPK